jgi:hypothetical protein
LLAFTREHLWDASKDYLPLEDVDRSSGYLFDVGHQPRFETQGGLQ